MRGRQEEGGAGICLPTQTHRLPNRPECRLHHVQDKETSQRDEILLEFRKEYIQLYKFEHLTHTYKLTKSDDNTIRRDKVTVQQ